MLRPLVVVTLVALASASAKAGNTESFFVGDDAALAAGSVVAVTHESSALYYNPAGLAGAHRNRVDLSASAFSLRSFNVPDALRIVRQNGRFSVDRDSNALRSVPSSIAFARRLSDNLTGAIGVFIPEADNESFPLTYSDADRNFPDAAAATDAYADQTLYHIGLGLGWQVSEKLRLGATLFVSYMTQTVFLQQSAATSSSASDVDFVTLSTRAALSRFGTSLKLGVQYSAPYGFELGAAIRTPTLQIHGRRHTVSQVAGNGLNLDGSIIQGFAVSDERETEGLEVVLPVELSGSVAKRFSDLTWVSAQVDFVGPLSNDDVVIDRRAVVNFRVGGRVAITERFGLGAGFFTDRSPAKGIGAFADTQVNFYGGTLGLNFRQPLSLAENPAEDALVFSTTVAGRYSQGTGEVGGAQFDLSTPGAVTSNYTRRDVTYREISLYIGTGIFF